MPKYHVLVREVHISTMEVKAEDADSAIRKVKDGAGEELILEYSHTLDSESWSVENCDGDEFRPQYPNS